MAFLVGESSELRICHIQEALLYISEGSFQLLFWAGALKVLMSYEVVKIISLLLPCSW